MDKEKLEKLMKNTFVDFTQSSEFIKAPVIFSRSEGPYVWDTEDKRYFDGIGGVFAASLGHRHPRLIEVMKKQIDILTFAPPLHGISEVTLQFVERLGKASPGNLNFIKSFSGGSESIEGALKLSRQYFKQNGKPDKMKNIGLYHGYHGATFGALSAGGGSRKSKFEPQMPGFIKMFSPIQLRDCFPTWGETCKFCATTLEKLILGEGADTVGSVIIEPICNTGGIITPTDEYFQIIRKTCDKYNVHLIFDEVLTGFGKTGDLFAAQTFGVTPDILCSGKGMCSGMIPAGSFMAKEEIGDTFFGASDKKDTFFAHGHTFASFPLANAVAIEVLDIMEEEKLPQRSVVIGERIKEHYKELENLGIVREIRGKGSLLGVEFVKDCVTNEEFPKDRKLGDALKKTAIKNGLIIRIDPDWFAVAPPLICSDAQIDEMCGLIIKSVKEALEMVSK